MFYKGKVHKIIFESQVNKNNTKNSNNYLAALYLLCAEKELWNVAKYKVTRREINFKAIGCNTLSVYGYTLYKMAQDIYTGSIHLTFRDVCNKYLINDKMFEIFQTALRICREGYSFIEFTKTFN